MEQEIWKDIKGYEGKYQVSNLGRIRSLYYHNAKGVKRDGFLKPGTDCKGYLRCALSMNNNLVTFKVHRLVAKAFLPNPYNLPQVNHINGNKQDNRVENLEWVNNSTNQIHAWINGLNFGKIDKGKKVIAKIGANAMEFPTIKKAAEYFGMCPSAIRRRILGVSKIVKNIDVEFYFNEI